ncbi:MAG: YceI family protein [Bacteroidia bacterium]
MYRLACFSLVYLFAIAVNFAFLPEEKAYSTEKGEIEFLSDAPLERIEARSKQLRGLVQLDTRRFAFSVAIGTFDGFNSELQREHFNENYLESQKFPQATFSGKLLDEILVNKTGKQTIRVKGQFTVHGVSKERTIEAQVESTKNKLDIRASFRVTLADHAIEIPRLVTQKIAESIQVTVHAQLEEK